MIDPTVPEQASRISDQHSALTNAVRAARDDMATSGDLLWDPFDPRWRNDPYSFYSELREKNPIHKSPLGMWVLTRHADCLAVLRDKRSSSDPRKTNLENLVGGRLRIGFVDPEQRLSQAIDDTAPFLLRDPPDHTRLRGLVQQAFTPRVVENLRPQIEQISEELVGDIVEKGSADLVSELAYPLPMKVITSLLGIPHSDHEQFSTWSDALARGLDPDYLLPPEAVQQRMHGILEFVGYFSELIAHRRENLGDDLLSGLISAEAEGSALSHGELISTCILLLVAGHETTVHLISGAALALIEHPDQMAKFKEDPSRAAVEEMLRYVSPVQLTGRNATEDMEVGDVTIAAGERAMLLLGSANRDPEVFEDPDAFDVTRSGSTHLGFGFGLHHCLGAPLARLESQVALSKLFSRVSTVATTSDNRRYRDTIVLRGLAELPVEIGR